MKNNTNIKKKIKQMNYKNKKQIIINKRLREGTNKIIKKCELEIKDKYKCFN